MGEVDSVRRVVDAMCAGIDRKVALVANCDGFRIDEALNDAYFAMVEELYVRHYSQATRYAASAFMRVKLGGALSTRQATAAVFESKAEAMTFFGWTGRRCWMSRGAALGTQQRVANLCSTFALQQQLTLDVGLSNGGCVARCSLPIFTEAVVASLLHCLRAARASRAATE